MTPFQPLLQLRRLAACGFLIALSGLATPAPAQLAPAKAAGAPTEAANAPDITIPPGGEPILVADPLASARLEQRPDQGASMEIVDVAGPGFSRAIRVDTGKASGNPTDVRLTWPAQMNINGSDVLFLTFWARTLESTAETGEGQGRVTFKGPDERADAIFFPKGANFDKTWKRWYQPLALRNGGPKGSLFAIELGATGTGKQIVEIGGLEFVNFRDRVRVIDLPFRRTTYQGREANAPWRARAAARIEKYRKGDLTVRVVNAKGRAVKGARVQVQMTRPAFKWGNGGNQRLYDPMNQSKDAVKYRETTKQLFDHIILGNGTIWGPWDNPEQQASTLRVRDWLLENGLPVHAGGHLVWPSWKWTPLKVKADYDAHVAADGEAGAREWLRAEVREQIRDVVTVNKGKISAYNVVNETRGNRDLLRILGEDELVEWFKVAREADPQAVLFINENAIERPGEKADTYAATIQFLLDRKAPLDAIGIQGHTGMSGGIEEFEVGLARFGKFGLPVEITEFDTVSPDEQLQADFARDFMTICFAEPSIRAFAMWGYWDGLHWLNDAPIFYRDWSIKPSGQVYKDLVFNQWWTNAQGTSDKKGDFKTRAFLGDYAVTVSVGGKTRSVNTQLAREGRTLTVTLPS